MASLAHPPLRACGLLVDSAVLEARLRADPAFYHGGAEVERLLRHDLARSRWVNDRVRQAAGHEAGVVLAGGPGQTVDAIMSRGMQGLWPGEAPGDGDSVTWSQETRPGTSRYHQK